jgi:RHS repeat-associated protein
MYMRFILLLLSLALQWNISGYGIDIPNTNRMPGINGKLLAVTADGNVPLHEWKTASERAWDSERNVEYLKEQKQAVITWIFEEGTFVPAAKLTDGQKLSIATDYLGTPEAMYSDDGETVWTCELNSYGKVRNHRGGYKTDCPFRYQGQYEDAETGLYYNRFRYYSPEEGGYLSQDPIGLMSDEFNLYSYVRDLNNWIDPFGLNGKNNLLQVNDRRNIMLYQIIKVKYIMALEIRMENERNSQEVDLRNKILNQNHLRSQVRKITITGKMH